MRKYKITCDVRVPLKPSTKGPELKLHVATSKASITFMGLTGIFHWTSALVVICWSNIRD